jgi:hypothetical protein
MFSKGTAPPWLQRATLSIARKRNLHSMDFRGFATRRAISNLPAEAKGPPVACRRVHVAPYAGMGAGLIAKLGRSLMVPHPVLNKRSIVDQCHALTSFWNGAAVNDGVSASICVESPHRLPELTYTGHAHLGVLDHITWDQLDDRGQIALTASYVLRIRSRQIN